MKTCLTRRKLVIIVLPIIIICTTYLCIKKHINTTSLLPCGHTKYDHYPLLRKTGLSLSELLKLDNVVEIYLLLSGDDTYSQSAGYITKSSETRLAENAIKDLIDRSESIEFGKKNLNNPEWIMFISNDFFLKEQLIEQLHLESNIKIWPIGPPNLLYGRFVKFHPSGLTIIWNSSSGMNEILIHDSLGFSSWCDVQVNNSFVETLENAIVQAEHDNIVEKYDY